MAVSAAKRRASNKWDKANMATLGCRLKKDTADAYRELCASRGESVSKALAAFIKNELEGRPVGEYENLSAEGESRE